MQGGEIFWDISWRGRFSIRIPLGINEKMKREKILRSKQCCSQCCSRSSLSPKQCFSPKTQHGTGKRKNLRSSFCYWEFSFFLFHCLFLDIFCFQAQLNIFCSLAKDFSTARLSNGTLCSNSQIIIVKRSESEACLKWSIVKRWNKGHILIRKLLRYWSLQNNASQLKLEYQMV